jgi:hypothetical protein
VNDELVPVGQGNPPEGWTGTLAPLNASVGGGPLFQAPVTLTGPFGAAVAVHVTPKMAVLATTPFCGMISVPVGLPPLSAAQNCHAPDAVTVAAVPRLVVHPVNVGVLIGPQTGPAGLGLTGAPGTPPLVDDVLQVTVAVPSVNVALIPGAVADAVAVKIVPAGETVVDWAYAGWAPSPITAAIATATTWTIDLRMLPAARGVSRLRRICIASMAVTPVGDCPQTRPRSGKAD